MLRMSVSAVCTSQLNKNMPHARQKACGSSILKIRIFKEVQIMPSKSRTNKLSIRLSPEEYKHFLAVQRSSGLSQADFLMRAIDNLPLPDERVFLQYKNISDKLAELNELVKEVEPKI